MAGLIVALFAHNNPRCQPIRPRLLNRCNRAEVADAYKECLTQHRLSLRLALAFVCISGGGRPFDAF